MTKTKSAHRTNPAKCTGCGDDGNPQRRKYNPDIYDPCAECGRNKAGLTEVPS